MIQKAYKFRLYPNNGQQTLLSKTFGATRFAWNKWVENFLSSKDHKKVFKTPKQFKQELDWMQEISSAAIQQKEIDFKGFKSQFFNKTRKKRLGKPSFKSKNKKQSYRLPNQKFDLDQELSKIRLEKIGWIKVVLDRMIPKDAKFLNVTISRDLVGDYFVSVLVEQEIQQLPKTLNKVGIDLGLKYFAVLSTGEKIEAPNCFRENQSEIKRISRHLSRKKKGSNSRFRAKRKLERLHRKTARQRSHFLHNLSSYVVNHFDLIAIEDLNVGGMIKNHCLSKSIQDASWSEFRRQLEYKSKWYGKDLRVIGRFVPSSKTCSVCGYYYKDLSLDIREWTCPCCGTRHDRDLNASQGILKTAVGVDTELQAWRERKTSLEGFKEAVPDEVLRVLEAL